MLIASMAAALALATTVCAGIVYQMHNEKVGKYGVKTKIEGQQTAETENRKVENHGAEKDYVELTASYLPDGMLDADAMKAFDADGNLLPMKLEYIKSKDGINTTDEVVKTETLPQKIVYATVKYENNGTETLHDIMYNGGIAFLEEKGSQMQFADYFLLSDEEKASIGCDYRELERVGFSQEVYLSDVTGGERNNNYINELKPARV